MIRPGHILLCAGAALLLAACSGDSDKPPLPGDRISILQLEGELEPDDQALEAQGFIAPEAWQNEFWPQAGGYPNHAMQNLSLNPGALQEAWRADIGDGASGDLPLTAQPVVADGRVYTLDTGFHLSAFDARDGGQIWRVDVANPDEDDSVIGGGISFAGGVLYVSNGYSEVLAVNPADGATYWRAALDGPARAAPTIINGRVFVTTLSNTLYALDAANGQLLWEFAGMDQAAGLLGAASPAANAELVIPAFSSGEIYALRVANGSVAWSDNLASASLRLGGLSGLTDIRGLPVIDKGLVIAISFGGKMVAIDERSGARVWQRDIGGSETPWVAGNHVFVLSSNNEVAALGRDNGVVRWVHRLKRYRDEESHSDPLFWTGPVLAGGRLILAGTNSGVAEINPETGELIREWSAGRSVRTPPVVAGDTLYLLGEDGTLMAFR